MIGRVWHGWTTHSNADAFEAYLRTEHWPSVMARNIAGLRSIRCYRLVRHGQTEFKVLKEFDSMDAVREFAGENYAKAIVPLRAQVLLRRYDARAEHFEILEIKPPDARAEHG